MADAKSLIKKYHYSKRVPTNIQFIGTLHVPGGLFGDFGEAVAAICFTIPASIWREPVLELARLVRKDDVRVPLTLLIRLAISRLKSRGYDLLISFADIQEGHYGGIYQAAGWNYHGQRSRKIDGLIINNNFLHWKTCLNAWGTRDPKKLKGKFPAWKIEPHYDMGKHLYWKALNRKGEEKAVRIGLQRNPYPKPNHH